MVVYVAQFPRSDERLESPDFKTVFRSACRWVQTCKDSFDANALCRVYKCNAELKKIRVDGGIEWKTDFASRVLLYDITHLSGCGLVMISRVMSWRVGLKTLAFLNARPWHYNEI